MPLEANDQHFQPTVDVSTDAIEEPFELILALARRRPPVTAEEGIGGQAFIANVDVLENFVPRNIIILSATHVPLLGRSLPPAPVPGRSLGLGAGTIVDTIVPTMRDTLRTGHFVQTLSPTHIQGGPSCVVRQVGEAHDVPVVPLAFVGVTRHRLQIGFVADQYIPHDFIQDLPRHMAEARCGSHRPGRIPATPLGLRIGLHVGCIAVIRAATGEVTRHVEEEGGWSEDDRSDDVWSEDNWSEDRRERGRERGKDRNFGPKLQE